MLLDFGQKVNPMSQNIKFINAGIDKMVILPIAYNQFPRKYPA
jgi:hypothetical protein